MSPVSRLRRLDAVIALLLAAGFGLYLMWPGG